MIKQYILFIVALICCSNTNLMAQCQDYPLSEAMKSAEQEFNEGELDDAIEIMEKALKVSKKKCFTLTAEARALLSKVYLMNNEEQKAEEIYYECLFDNPSYEPNSFELEEFALFAKNFSEAIIPKWSLEINVSSVFTPYNSGDSRQFVTSNERNNYIRYYSRLGWSGSINGSYHYNRNLEFSIGIGYLKKSTWRDDELIYFYEDQHFLSLPMSVTLNMRMKRLIWNISLGATHNKLLKVHHSNVYTIDESYNYSWLSDYDVPLILRHKYQTDIFSGLGIAFSPRYFNGNYLTFNVRYSYSPIELRYGAHKKEDVRTFIQEQVNAYDSGDSEATLITHTFREIGYLNQSSDLNQNYWQFSIGYNHIFYRKKFKSK